VPADGYDIRAGFWQRRGDHTDAGAGDEFDADASLDDSAQIVNELREVFDAVNVVVRRRRNQRSAGRRVANARMYSVTLRAELPAFAGFWSPAPF